MEPNRFSKVRHTLKAEEERVKENYSDSFISFFTCESNFLNPTLIFAIFIIIFLFFFFLYFYFVEVTCFLMRGLGLFFSIFLHIF